MPGRRPCRTTATITGHHAVTRQVGSGSTVGRVADAVIEADPTGSAVEPVLACRGLRKVYGTRVAVDGVGFTIARGETYGLIGPNGAGKTTTISMVCGLLTRDGGDVTVAGRPMSPDAIDAKAAVGLVPQDVALYEDLSAQENLV
ncbi:MAG: ATP-binding cassette domain-containing protein, partial [Acidimicrobiales bacterium]|nr:ATP-binding cassette domain-containing protein [Acidimicrobiales bacterium]